MDDQAERTRTGPGRLVGYADPVLIEIDRLDRRPASEVRARFNAVRSAEYEEAIDDLPALLVVADAGDVHWVSDGLHRLEAYFRQGVTMIPCRVKPGTYLDAYRDACHANDAHGIPATGEDKQKRVETALKHPVMGTWSQRAIADACGVDQSTVSKYDTRAGDGNHHLKTTGRDGKQYPAARPRKPRAADTLPELPGDAEPSAPPPPPPTPPEPIAEPSPLAPVAQPVALLVAQPGAVPAEAGAAAPESAPEPRDGPPPAGTANGRSALPDWAGRGGVSRGVFPGPGSPGAVVWDEEEAKLAAELDRVYGVYPPGARASMVDFIMRWGLEKLANHPLLKRRIADYFSVEESAL